VFYLYFYQLVMGFSLLASIFVIVLAWRRRGAPGTAEMIALAAAAFVWTLGYFIEANSGTLAQQLFFNNVGYIGSMSAPVAWFIFALRYTSSGRPLAGWKIALLSIIPLVTIVLVWTNNWHHLMWFNEHLVTSGPFTVTSKTYGWFFYIAAGHNYGFIIAGAIILIWRLFTGAPLYKKQATTLVIAALLPLLWNIIYVFNLAPLPRKDLTPVAFAASGIVLALGLLRFHIFRAVPFAHRFVMQQLRDGVLIFDMQDNLLEANTAAIKIIGSNNIIVGKALGTLAQLSPVMENIMAVRQKRQKLPLTIPAGDNFYELEMLAMRDKQKEQPVGWLVMLHDVTERQRAEESRLELERRAQAASRLAIIGEMAAGIAHEINNPLTPIIGFSEMLLKRDLPQDVKDELQIIYDSARRTADVTRRLLTFARQSKPERSLSRINEIIDATLKLRAYQLKSNRIRVTTEMDPGLPPTLADASQLQQVFLNLIMNAEYAMHQAHGGGNLIVRTEKMDAIIRISFRDDGPGIAAENQGKLFTPFFTTKKVGEGTGLGLSVCHGIIAEHKGRIYAESPAAGGAVFIVELPILTQEEGTAGGTGDLKA
jgi:signal transduction histidine kinase